MYIHTDTELASVVSACERDPEEGARALYDMIMRSIDIKLTTDNVERTVAEIPEDAAKIRSLAKTYASDWKRFKRSLSDDRSELYGYVKEYVRGEARKMENASREREREVMEKIERAISLLS